MVEQATLVNWVLWLTIASIPFFVIAWRCAWREQHRAALVWLVLAGALLRTGPALDPYLHVWDERYHALVAKHMMDEPLHPKLYSEHVLPYDRLSWTEGTDWYHKPPFPLWCMAASMKAFGVSEFSMRLPTLLASILGIWVCAGIISRYWGRRTAFVAAFLYGIQGSVIEISSGRWATDHMDGMFTFLIGASILVYLRSLQRHRAAWLLLSGALLGCALLSKWLPALIVLPVNMLFAIGPHKRTWRSSLVDVLIIGAIATLITAPWMLHVHQRFPDIAAHESMMRYKHITEALDGQSGGPFYYIDRIRVMFGELVYLPLIWFMMKAWAARRNWARWAFVVWAGGFIVFFSSAATKLHGYVLPIAIPTVGITAMFWVTLERAVRGWKRARWAGLLVLVGLLALPVRYCIERLKPLQDLTADMRTKERLIRSIGPGAPVVLNCPMPIEAMFYTDCIAYGGGAPEHVLDSLIRNGRRVVILEHPIVR